MASSERQTASPFPQSSIYRSQVAKDYPDNTTGNFEALNSLSPRESDVSERLRSLKTPPSITRSLLLRKSITQSTIMPLEFRDRNTKPDQLLALYRREKATQTDIQHLLDAQSAALLQGYDESGEDLSENSSRTSADKKLQNVSSSRVVPVRQPQKKLIGLRGARSGLTAKMEELIYIKREELTVYEHEISVRNNAITVAKNWEIKLNKLNEQLNNYSDDSNIEAWRDKDIDKEKSEFTRLKEEEKTVETKIRQVENELIQLIARQEWIRGRIDESANKKEARLSSYRGALRNAEFEIKEFLRNPPVPNSFVMGEEKSFTTLSASKRSLTMAIEWWEKESSQASLSKQKAEEEKKALEEGIQVWEPTIQIISEFENDLREKLKSERTMDVVDLKDQITKIDSIIKNLEINLHTAARRGWNLLICAIGAELEAFKKGQNILKMSLVISENESSLKTCPFSSSNANYYFDMDTDENTRQSLERELTKDDISGISSFNDQIKDSG
ncbi:putative autophagy-related protein 28 [Erysiphe neolycopersici]|uniref:Putative autophagy-related protein 28 n=1 Tax=Erysiphe neolycopersici TaxID=212602 RepID=A0A420HRM4_9PEZI|nr:putative autophagy-related protein 28 [Erysiphe neolycopersici]